MCVRDISRKLGYSRSAVYAWLTAFRKNGAAGLEPRRVPGRPPLLSFDQKVELKKILEQEALSSGYPKDRWTSRRAAEVIEKRFGIRFHPNHLWRILKGLRRPLRPDAGLPTKRRHRRYWGPPLSDP